MYNSLEQNDINHFQTFLKQSEIITDKDDIYPYNVDWLKKYSG